MEGIHKLTDTLNPEIEEEEKPKWEPHLGSSKPKTPPRLGYSNWDVAKETTEATTGNRQIEPIEQPISKEPTPIIG